MVLPSGEDHRGPFKEAAQLPFVATSSPWVGRPRSSTAMWYTAIARKTVARRLAAEIPRIIVKSRWMQFWHTVVKENVENTFCTPPHIHVKFTQASLEQSMCSFMAELPQANSPHPSEARGSHCQFIGQRGLFQRKGDPAAVPGLPIPGTIPGFYKAWQKVYLCPRKQQPGKRGPEMLHVSRVEHFISRNILAQGH